MGGLFLVPFIAFIVPGNMFFPFITGKGFTFRILVEILFGLYVILSAMAPEYRPKITWITKAAGIFVLATLVADLFSANVLKSLWSNYERMEGFVLIAHLALYYIVASGMFRTASRWYQWINVSLGASVIMSFYGVLQLMGKLTISQGGVRLDGTFGNASYLAIYLVFHIFLALYMLSQTNRPAWQKWIYVLVALFETYILYFTATRGAILGLIGGLLLSAIIIAWKEKENKTLRKTAYGVLIGVVVLVAGFIAIRNASFVQKSPVLSRFATLSLSSSELETQGRYYVWPMAVKGFLERPIFGWGQESFNYVFNKNYDPRMYTQEQWFDRTHDIVLDWLISGGIVGFLAYAGMYAALMYYIWRKQSNLTVTEKSLLTGMISAYVFNNIFVFDNLVSYIMFFSVLAYVHTMSSLRESPAGKFYTYEFSKETLQYAIAPLVIVVTFGVVYFVNVPAIEENLTLISAITPSQSGGAEENLSLFKKAFSYNSFGNSEVLEQLTMVSSQIAQSSQVSNTVKAEFYALAKAETDKQIAETPHDARYLLFAGSLLNGFGQYDSAIPYLQSALAESPRKQSIYFELATSYIGKKDYAGAFDLFKKAYDLEPSYPDAQILYTIGAIYTKNTDVLKVFLPKIGQKTITTDNRFLQAYADIGDYQTVISILNARIESDPTNLQYQLSLASAYLQIGQKQKAIDIINQMIKEDPGFKTQGEGYIKQIQGS